MFRKHASLSAPNIKIKLKDIYVNCEKITGLRKFTLVKLVGRGTDVISTDGSVGREYASRSIESGGAPGP